MAAGVIDLEHWRQFEERTKDAWRELVRQHGFNPDDVTFPLVIDGDTMIVREWLRNEDGHRYFNADRSDAASKTHEVRLRTEVGIPRICRTDT